MQIQSNERKCIAWNHPIVSDTTKIFKNKKKLEHTCFNTMRSKNATTNAIVNAQRETVWGVHLSSQIW